LRAEAERAGVQLGEPRFDDDAFGEKIAVLRRDPVAVVSFTFGIPPEGAIEQLHTVGSEVWLTVTRRIAREARAAIASAAARFR
jgi:nitronate monooxygenase